MIKYTIFKYEIKRQLCSREYLILLAAIFVYCISLLRSMVMFGINYTAPFSQWTFCSYISAVSPVLFVALLSLCARQFTVSERGTMTIIESTPMPAATFRAIRYIAIACVFLIAMAIPFGICFVFYQQVFDYTAFGELIYSGLMLLVPPSLFIFGAAMLLGRRRPVLIYILMGAVLIAGTFSISLPPIIDIIGSSVIQPISSGTRNFTFRFSFIASRIVFVFIGIACSFISLWQINHRKIRFK